MKQLKAISVPLLMLIVLLTTIACSSHKNTASSRWWQGFNTRYNVYYNGKLAYIDGALEKEKSNKDNFTELLPLYTVANKQSKNLGSGSFDRAIEKSKKAIKLHSITKRPEWTKQRRKTEKDIEWLSRKEYNPFIWKAWLLMGRSQFHKGEFDEAAATFSYMSRLYKTQPAIYGRARAWLAKCYIEQGWLYDAEDVIRNMQRDSIHWRAQKEWNYTLADYYIHTKDYQKAVVYLRKVIQQEMRKKQKAREWFLMGQLQELLGNNNEAYKAYQHVVRLNPPYETEFNARIAMTEVLADKQSAKMAGKLRRMALSDKNKDYKDRIYYALGNIYLLQKDSLKAISSYERGRKESTRNGIEKGVLLLKLGDIYWNKEQYDKAKSCYGEAIGLIDKEREDYPELSKRSTILDKLVPFTNEIALQDSLQALALMPESARNAAIDRVITALKKKEKEERSKEQEDYARNIQRENGGFDVDDGRDIISNNNANDSKQWYFYNQQVVNQGKAAFEKLWGRRENTDNWQRSNKTVVGTNTNKQNAVGQENNDTTDIIDMDSPTDSVPNMSDSSDPHKRSYYLAQIPFTPEQLKESNDKLSNALYQSAVIFKDELDNLRLSEHNFMRLETQFPGNSHEAEAYYHLYLLYSRYKNTAKANHYLALLKDKYPKNELTNILTDPYFVQDAQNGKHFEDSLYAETYEAFKANDIYKVRNNLAISTKRFPKGANRDKFLFIGALGKLNNGEPKECLEDLENIVTNFPNSKLNHLAGNIINGVKAGRKLQGGKFDMSKMWNQRSEVLNNTDSTAVKSFTNDTNIPFMVLMVYNPDSIDKNKLLYAIAKYNFTGFPVRSFDIDTQSSPNGEEMQIGGFNNFDEALLYARKIRQQRDIIRLLSKAHIYVISNKNAELLHSGLGYEAYEKFYNKHFSAAKLPPITLLNEPSSITTAKELDNNKTEEAPKESIDNGATVIPLEPELVAPKAETIIPLEEIKEQTPQQGTQQGSTTVIIEDEKPQPKASTNNDTKKETKATPAPTTKGKQPQKTATKQPTTTKPTTKTPQQQPKKLPAKEETTTTRTGIYFGDGFGEPASKTPTQNKQEKKDTQKKDEKKTKRFDLEDDYYELEGF